MKVENRTIALLEYFGKKQQALTLTEIANGMKIPISSCFNLVRTLEELGFLYVADSSRRIYPTRKIMTLAQEIVAGDQWIRKLEPRLQKLREDTQETVVLAKLQRRQALYIAVLDGPQQIRYTANVGDVRPLHTTAAGKALLSAMPRDQRDKLVAKLPLEQRTKNSLTDRKALLRVLDQCAQDGFATTLGENIPEVAALARPLTLNGDIHAITIAGPMARVIENMASHRRHLAATCDALQKQH